MFALATETILTASSYAVDPLGGAAVGVTYFGEDGTTVQRIGNTTFHSDGLMKRRVGNTRLYRNAAMAHRVGSLEFAHWM